MYYFQEQQKIINSHSEFRALFKNQSMPRVLTDEYIESFGVYPVKQVEPEYNKDTEKATMTTPILVDGTWTQQWSVESIVPTDPAELQAFIQQLGETVKNRINTLHSEKLYTNVTAMFPNGEKVIQFRSEQDRTNLSDVASAAMALIISGTPEAPMVWRTEDNVNQAVPAQQMVSIAMGVLESKQAILSAAWAHKDAIAALVEAGNLQGLIDYDITVGWPG